MPDETQQLEEGNVKPPSLTTPEGRAEYYSDLAQMFVDENTELSKRVKELEADRAKLIAQLDATKKFAYNLYLLARNTGDSAPIYAGQLYAASGSLVNFSPEDWYNVDRSTVIPRYLTGEFDEGTACDFLQVDLMTFRRMAQAAEDSK